MRNINKSLYAALVLSFAFTAPSKVSMAGEYSFRTVVLSARDGTGDSAPNTGATFCCFPRSDGERIPRLNDVGATAFLGFLHVVSASNDEFVFVENTDLTLIARDGDLAPDTSAFFNSGIAFTPRGLGFNNSGNVAFNARLTGEGIPSDQGIVLVGLSYGSIHGVPPEPVRFSDPRTWVPFGLSLIGYSPFANFRE